MTLKVVFPGLRVLWAQQPRDPEPTFVPSDAQARLARVETMLADHARSEGLTPYGSV